MLPRQLNLVNFVDMVVMSGSLNLLQEIILGAPCHTRDLAAMLWFHICLALRLMLKRGMPLVSRASSRTTSLANLRLQAMLLFRMENMPRSTPLTKFNLILQGIRTTQVVGRFNTILNSFRSFIGLKYLSQYKTFLRLKGSTDPA